MTATTGKTALIIGASRGLGYALAAEYLTRASKSALNQLMRSFATPATRARCC